MDMTLKNLEWMGDEISLIISGGEIDKIIPPGGNAGGFRGETIDCRGKALYPFLHNGHTHSPMVLLRGYGDDMALHDWLSTRIWPVEAKLSEEDYYWGNRLALLEMIKGGTGFFNEMYMNPSSMIEALREYPLKAVINFPIIDLKDENRGKEQIGQCLRFLDKTDFPSNVTPGIALHSVYANSEYSLRWASECARSRSIPLHIHISETEREVEDCRKEHRGLSPVAYLDKIGFFRDNRVYGAHCVWLDDGDPDIMADHQVVAVHNPVSNMKLAVGQAFPYEKLRRKGIPMALGTDGAASNNNLDMFEEMKIAALLQKHHFRNPTLLPAREVFSLASGESARIFSTGTGLIEEGSPADFMLVRTGDVSMIPGTDLISNLVYSAGGSVVTDLYVRGNPLMRDRVVKGEEDIKINAVRCAGRLLKGEL